jgi:hypothetical protein
MTVSCVLVGTYEWCPDPHALPAEKSLLPKHLALAPTPPLQDEHFWFGVSSDAADRVLGTSPEQSGVAKSETVRTLGIGG